MRRLVPVQLAALALAPAAHAAWSPSHRLDPQIPPRCHIHARIISGDCYGEPSPRVAVNRRGEVVAAWVDLRDRVKVALGDRRGRFGRVRVVGHGLRPAVSIGADGAAVAAWTSHGTLRYARRAPGHGFGRSHVLAPRGSREGDDDVRLVAQPDGSIFVAYDSPFRGPKGNYTDRVRTLVVPAQAAPGVPTTLWRGDVEGLAASPGGDVAICCERRIEDEELKSQRLATRRAGADWTFAELGSDDVEAVAIGASTTLLGTLDIYQAGDAITLGTPGAIAVGPNGSPAPKRLAPVKRPSKSFGPVPVVDGTGRALLVYQEKNTASDFSASAPLYAAVLGPQGFTTRTPLDNRPAYEPLTAATDHGAIVAWQRAGGRWGLAIERGGRFTPVRGPAGRVGTLGEDASSNRDLAAAGRYVALVWESASDGSIRVSVGRPPA